MFTLYLVHHGSGSERVREETRLIVEPLAELVPTRWVNECPHGAWAAALVSDDLISLRNGGLLPATLRRLSGPHLWVIGWDTSVGGGALVGLQGISQVFDLPKEGERLRRALSALADAAIGPHSEWVLRPDLPPSLAVALRKILALTRAGTDDPPPRTVAGAAELAGCARTTLSAAASRCSVDLAAVCSLCVQIWLLGQPSSLREASVRLGYVNAESLSRWVRRKTDLTWAEFRSGPTADVWRRLRTLLRDVLVSPAPRAGS